MSALLAMRLRARSRDSSPSRITVRRGLDVLASLVLSVGITSVLMAVLDANPVDAFQAIWRGAFGTSYAVGQTLQVTSVLTLAALAAALPFRSGVLNIGAEGQMVAGSVATTYVALGLHLPGWLVVPAALVAGFLGGAVWGGIVGLLRALLGANEVINALMLNFVAILVADYVIAGKWADTLAPQTKRFPTSADLPALLGQPWVTAMLIALALVALAWLLLERSAYGFGLRVQGANPDAAVRAGINGTGTTIVVMLIGGGLAGAAGVLQTTSVDHALVSSPAQGYGYTAIAVALLATLRLPLIPLSALFFAALTVGGNSLPAVTGVSTSAAVIVQAVFVLSLLATGVVRVRTGVTR